MVFLLLNCMSSLYILDISTLSDICYAIFFSHSVGVLFILFMVSFAMQKLFSFMCPTCLFLLLMPLLWVSNPKNHCQNQCQRSYLFCFLSGFYGFRSYSPAFNPFWVNFCVWCKIVVWFHPFAYSCPVFPTPFIEETVLSPLYILSSFVVN